MPAPSTKLLRGAALCSLAASLIACSEPKTPDQVAEAYWHAISTGDNDAARAMVSDDSRAMYEQHLREVHEEPIDSFLLEPHQVTVETRLNPQTDRNLPDRERRFGTVLKLENGEWKIDLNQTFIPRRERRLDELADEFGNDMEKGAEQMRDAIEEHMGEGMNLLNEFMKEGSQEMERSMNDALRELRDKMEESVEAMKKRREQDRQQEQAPTPPPAKEDGQGLI